VVTDGGGVRLRWYGASKPGCRRAARPAWERRPAGLPLPLPQAPGARV